jgi:hypothetical protein
MTSIGPAVNEARCLADDGGTARIVIGPARIVIGPARIIVGMHLIDVRTEATCCRHRVDRSSDAR